MVLFPPNAWVRILRDGRTIDDRIRDGHISKIPARVRARATDQLAVRPRPSFRVHNTRWPYRYDDVWITMDVRLTEEKSMRWERAALPGPFLRPFESWVMMERLPEDMVRYKTLLVVEQDGQCNTSPRAHRLACGSRAWRWLMRSAGLRAASFLARLALRLGFDI